MATEVKNRPAFFTVFFPDFPSGSDGYEIPPAILQFIQQSELENFTFRDSYKNLWQVSLEMVGDRWCFGDGWTKFVTDNSLEEMDIVIYEYSSDGIFNMKVLGRFGCEKKGARGPLHNLIELAEKAAEEEAESGESKDCNVQLVSRQEHERNNDQGGVATSTSADRTRNKRDADWYGMEIFGSGQAAKPNNPYFVTKTRRNRAFELYIPGEVIERHKLELPQIIFLVDPCGRMFEGKLSKWKDGRVFYCGGWKSLCKRNSVGHDDKCICEFVQCAGGGMYLRVSFVRARC